MSMRTAPVILFQRALHVWLLLWLLSALPAMEWLWEHPVSPELLDPGIRSGILRGFGVWLPSGAVLPVVFSLLLLTTYGVFRRPPWWMALLIWLFFCALSDRAWLANNGGTWLMRNAFFWSIFLRPGRSDGPDIPTVVAYWILRLQLLLAYAITSIHKLQGTTWISGTALGLIASDPTYGASSMPYNPLLTWAALVFQLTFPMAVWWLPTRLVWSLLGILFHSATAFWLGIPDMAFAFLVHYALWIGEGEAAWIMHRFKWLRSLGPL